MLNDASVNLDLLLSLSPSTDKLFFGNYSMWSNKDEKKFSFKPHTEIGGEEEGWKVDEEIPKMQQA